MEDEKYNGIIEDPRSEEQKAQDYKHEDLAQGEIVLNWKEYDKDKVRKYEIQDQDASSSCVAQGLSKVLAIHEVKEGRDYTRLCPKFIYTRRENYPAPGMWLPNALSIACSYGACKESTIPCNFKSESFMNDKAEPEIALIEAKNYRGKYYFQITGGIDKVAEVLEQGYGVLLGFRNDPDEWKRKVPVVKGEVKSMGHGVACVDYCLWNGEKALIIEDSWSLGTTDEGRRIITEDFFNKKCFYAGYVTSLENYVFSTFLKRGSRGLAVKKLQEKLGIVADGVFGRLTEDAVKRFQMVNKLVPDGLVGPKTNAVLNL